MNYIITKAVNEIFNVLDSAKSEGALNINGSVYKLRRPLNSVKEDVVVNAVAMTDDAYMQEGILNVNAYVRNISEQNIPNTRRLDEIASQIHPLLKEVWGSNFVFFCQQQQLFEEENEVFINFRIKYNVI